MIRERFEFYRHELQGTPGSLDYEPHDVDFRFDSSTVGI